MALLIGVGAIVREAIARIRAPEPAAATPWLWVCGDRIGDPIPGPRCYS